MTFLLSAGPPWSGLCPHLPWLSGKYQVAGAGAAWQLSDSSSCRRRAGLPLISSDIFYEPSTSSWFGSGLQDLAGGGEPQGWQPRSLPQGSSAYVPHPRPTCLLPGIWLGKHQEPESMQSGLSLQPLSMELGRPGSLGWPLASGVTSLASVYLPGEWEQ